MDAGYRARYNQDEPQRPYRPLPNITSLPPPEPGFSVSAFIFILSIIFAGFGVVGYMVFFLGRCTWNGITGMRKKLSFIGHLVHELLRKKMPV
jgi:hypothetical protein